MQRSPFQKFKLKTWAFCVVALVTTAVFVYIGQALTYSIDADALRAQFASSETKRIIGSNPYQLSIVHNMQRSHPHYHRVMDYLGSTGLSVQSSYLSSMDPALVKKLAFSEEAMVAIWSGALKDQHGQPQIRRFFIGNDVLVARQRLRRFDGAFQLRVLQFRADKSKVGFTVSHGEHAWVGDKNSSTLKRYEYLKSSLRNSYMDLSSLPNFIRAGSLQGFSAIVSLDPSGKWFESELAEVDQFLQKGGNWFICLESPKALQSSVLGAWFAKKGIVHSAPIASEQNHIRLQGRKSDRGFVLVEKYGDSPVARVLRRQPALSATVFGRPFLVSGKVKSGVAAFPPADAFVDLNGDYQPGGFLEKVPEDHGVVLAQNVGKGKLLLSADCQWVQDFLMGSSGNKLLWAGIHSWLFSPQASSLPPDSKDQFLVRTSSQSKSFLWFTTALVPLAVIWLGFVNLAWFRRS